MTGWGRPHHGRHLSVVHEIDTAAWLRDVSTALGRTCTLADVPIGVWEQTVPSGADAVWLMGVWERSPAGRRIALEDPTLWDGFRAALPDVGEADVAGSPYCVRRYVVDDRFGGPSALAAARARLATLGLGLVLDHVPNHVAPDHPWARERPWLFVRGTAEDAERDPRAWLQVGDEHLARGRDPYFPPWPDVVQLNAFHPALRTATADVLTRIGGQCDAMRCDMAMLMVNDVFGRTWGEHVGRPPEQDFWPEVAGLVRQAHPDLVLIAEAYWDMEWPLLHQGFDFSYDKRLYDRLVHSDAAALRAHLGASPDYQRHLVRFTENHDEPRAATALGPGRVRAAAVTIATVPGLTLWHDGQFEGRRTHLPVFLGRRPREAVDGNLRDLHLRLIEVAPRIRRGAWTLLTADGWPDNPTHQEVLAWSWHSAGEPAHVVVVNWSAAAAQARIRLPFPSLGGSTWQLTDELTGATYHRDGEELRSPGLFVDLPAWGSHVFSVEAL